MSKAENKFKPDHVHNFNSGNPFWCGFCGMYELEFKLDAANDLIVRLRDALDSIDTDLTMAGEDVAWLDVAGEKIKEAITAANDHLGRQGESENSR